MLQDDIRLCRFQCTRSRKKTMTKVRAGKILDIHMGIFLLTTHLRAKLVLGSLNPTWRRFPGSRHPLHSKRAFDAKSSTVESWQRAGSPSCGKEDWIKGKLTKHMFGIEFRLRLGEALQKKRPNRQSRARRRYIGRKAQEVELFPIGLSSTMSAKRSCRQPLTIWRSSSFPMGGRAVDGPDVIEHGSIVGEKYGDVHNGCEREAHQAGEALHSKCCCQPFRR